MAISNKNSKLGNIPNVSLPPIKSCGNCKGCSRQCYALKAYRVYKTARNSWDSNFSMARKNPEAYFNMVREYLGRKKPRMFRWHVSGDILDQEYLENMKAIARDFPETGFLAFTKMYHLSYARRPKNLEIVFSAWPSTPIKRKKGINVAWVQNGSETRIPDSAIECSGHCDSCGMCWSLSKLGRDVFFHIH